MKVAYFARKLATCLSCRPVAQCLAALLLTTVSLSIGCESGAEPPVPPATKNVVVTNYPLAYFAERLLGDEAIINYPVPEDADPAYWNPDAAAIEALQKADLIVINGAGYESWRETVTLPDDRIVETTANLTSHLIAEEAAVTHSHGPEGEHTHSHMASHTWLDPHLAVAQASAFAMALADEMPEMGPTLTANAVSLSEDLVGFEGRFIERTEVSEGWSVIGSHPVYQYLGHRLKWKLHSVHWEPGETPSDEEFAALQTYLMDHPSGMMIWEDEPTAETREKLTAMGLKIVVYRTCGNRPAGEDYLSEMNANLDRLAAVIDELAKTNPPAETGE